MANAKVDLRGAQRKLSGPNITRGRVAMANQALMDMDPFVPKRDHNLAASGHVTDSGKSIEYNTPYARAHFHLKKAHHLPSKVIPLLVLAHVGI